MRRGCPRSLRGLSEGDSGSHFGSSRGLGGPTFGLRSTIFGAPRFPGELDSLGSSKVVRQGCFSRGRRQWPQAISYVSFCIGAVLDSMHRAYVWCMVGEAAWEWDTCDNCLYWTQPCRCLLAQRERGWGKGPDVRSFRVDDGSTWPTGWLPTTFDPCTGIGNQTLAVYRKPPRRGRIHIIGSVAKWLCCPLREATSAALPYTRRAGLWAVAGSTRPVQPRSTQPPAPSPSPQPQPQPPNPPTPRGPA